MKKLLLASNGKFLIDEGYKFLGIPKEKLRIGYVITASKGVDNLEYLERHRRELIDRGYNFEEIDIEGKTEKELRDFFGDKNVIHMEGGNTFYLLKAVKESGFDKIIKDLVGKGMVYVGTSAGAYIASPTIETSTWKDDPKDRHGLIDLTALHLVPFLLKVHYTDDERKLIEQYLAKCTYPVRILRDGQGILVKDSVYELVGEGDEVRLRG